MKSKMNLNSEHLLELAALEINTIWRMQYFFRYCLNTTVCKYWHSKCISTEICLAALNVGGKLKVRFHLPAKQLFILTWEKSYDYIYLSPPHVSIITGNILKTIIRLTII